MVAAALVAALPEVVDGAAVVEVAEDAELTEAGGVATVSPVPVMS